MTTLVKLIIAAVLTLLTFTVQAQSIAFSAKVIDTKTQEPIPFATVETGKNRGTITNEEGIFSVLISAGNRSDSIYISSMGYEKKGFLPQSEAGLVLALTPKTTELSTVFLTDNPLEADEIIERVKENMATNYPNTLSRKRIFFRHSLLNNFDKMEIKFKKSTIPELNKALIDSIENSISRSSSYYSESVSTLVGNYTQQKLFVDKAAKLYDKNAEVSFEGLNDRLETIFKENVKPDSYLKIKSGWFGTKVALDELSSEEGEQQADEEGGVQVRMGEDPTEKDITAAVKENINELYENLFFQEGSKLDVLDKSNRYKFDISGYTEMDEAIVYIINFEPKGGKDFAGVLYVNADDFAVMRLEYRNVKRLRNFKLLGIFFRETIYRGKSIFGKDENGYSLRYAEHEKGAQFGIDRPLTVIEKNKNVKGPRKQNELDLGIDMSMQGIDKMEFVVFNSAMATEGEFDSAAESTNAEATYLKAYDPTFWKGYTIIEPNQAIQNFKVLEEE